MKEIWHEIGIRATPPAVFAALTEPALLGQWWISGVSGSSTPGAVLAFSVNEDFTQEVEVLEIDKDARVVWRPLQMGLADWIGSGIEFVLRKAGFGTVVTFRHYDYRPGVAAFPHYSMSWAVYLLSLRALLETGSGFVVRPDGSYPSLTEYYPAVTGG